MLRRGRIQGYGPGSVLRKWHLSLDLSSSLTLTEAARPPLLAL
jgi:hypothetical protein